ncbi:hypothetical protein [Streptomyces griseorubiginosus]|uniref:hypothetical protein n=1 Tax=Streptomyces griseorubiginosus TaxID=67304 RepID=UPI0033FAC001
MAASGAGRDPIRAGSSGFRARAEASCTSSTGNLRIVTSPFKRYGSIPACGTGPGSDLGPAIIVDSKLTVDDEEVIATDYEQSPYGGENCTAVLRPIPPDH